MLCVRLLGRFVPSSLSSARCYSSDSANKKSTTSEPIQITEDLPAIPPSKGWPGDENTQSLYKIHEIRKSFKYG